MVTTKNVSTSTKGPRAVSAAKFRTNYISAMQVLEQTRNDEIAAISATTKRILQKSKTF